MIDGDTPAQIGGFALLVIGGLVAAAKGADWLMRAAERFGFVRTPSAWKLEAEALAQRIDDLNEELQAVRTENVALKAEVAELRSRPDLSAVIDALAAHERREVDAWERIAAGVETLLTKSAA